MSNPLEDLVQAQHDLYGLLARSYDNMMKSGAAKVTIGLLEARLQTLEGYWAKFMSRHEQLLLEYGKELAKHDYIKEDLMLKADIAYHTQKGQYLEDLSVMRGPENVPGVAAAAAVAVAAPVAAKLPRIAIPQFSGKYEDWPAFRDLFVSLVVINHAVTPVEKLHYLKTSLKGEAEQVARQLPTTGANFERTWRALIAHYENRRLLVRAYIARLLALPKMKGESASDLRKIYHCVHTTVGALEGIGRPLTQSDDLAVQLITELLDPVSRREWETELSKTTEPPSLEEILEFVSQRMRTLESLAPSKCDASSAKASSGSSRQRNSLQTSKPGSQRGRCFLCSKEHYLRQCETYLGKSAVERRQYVDASALCVNCLGKHKLTECPSRTSCLSCGARHHSSLHDAFTAVAAVTSHLARPQPTVPMAVLLATARVRVTDRHGVDHVARALVDQGSESSLVSESLAQRLRLPRSASSVEVYGVGGVRTGVTRGLVTLRVSPRDGGSPMSISAYVFPRLTLYDSGVRADPSVWSHLRGLTLADPDFLAADPVEILLGADVYASILQSGLRKGGRGQPAAQRTSLGWILSGPVGSAEPPARALTLQCRVDEELTSLVRGFWQQEELPASPSPLTPADQECEDVFRRSHRRREDGRYVVRLPVIEPLPDLATTRRAALRALTSMERRLARDDRLSELYVGFMRTYEDLGHMVRADAAPGGRTSYLPHHGVLREASSTTKLRVVFNGSTTTASGKSLNRSLLVGPNLLPPLADVLLKWRRHRYVLATDVEKMFRQILVHSEDHNLQRILWRCSTRDEVAEFCLTTVTYGLACAPFLAMRTLRQLADDEAESYPLGSRALREDAYMDDVLTGAPTKKEAIELRRQLTDLCMAGGFPLRKWSANESEILAEVPVEHRMQQELRDWRPHETHGTLGLRWHPATDEFSFAIPARSLTTVSKRTVLAFTARLFDPLGWLAPAVVRAKIAFQSTWLLGLGWDDPLDGAAERLWRSYEDELPLLESVRVPRMLETCPARGDAELHGFADASERAYAAVLYLRTGLGDSWRTCLVAARTKVAPIKPVTLPRLELCAAALLARLTSHVRSTLGLGQAPAHLWSDSTVALGWIRGHPTRWKTFVSNRVAEIQTQVADAQWHHVPGLDNPADCASRGLPPGELVAHPLWWRGPPWLRAESSSWPTAGPLPDDKDLPEERLQAHAVKAAPVPVEEPEELLRFSLLSRLLRVTAWCRRWWYRQRVPGAVFVEIEGNQVDVLTTPELEEARTTWIRRVQLEHYRSELVALQRSLPLPSSSSLSRLTPFCDSQGLLRVGGRLRHALLAYDERHPVLLPGGSHFTRLVVEACHLRALHGGVQTTMGVVRQRYWIPRGRAVIKRWLHRCVRCVRWRADVPQQLMGSLPRERVTPGRPFLDTGVDYAGPILLRATKGRGHRAYKAFVAVFVCLATRAVHLEAVSDYSADAFLAALRRFVSRRGLCRTLRSDCGTNFVGADAQLRAFFAASSPDLGRVVGQLASEQIQWRFNPPSAPHFGGIWEAAVKSLKHHLRRVLGDSTLTFEEMSTLLAQVEACLNSRPLQALSDDPEDLAALTPGHFLVGSALTAVPEPSLRELPVNRLTRWQLLQQMRDHFWERWSREYLHSLIHRPKWLKGVGDFSVGRLCLIRHENTPPARWPLARIVRVHRGEDGQIRVVTVRTAASEFTRPIVKLILLPVSENEASEETLD
ncbi:uncharacterized protein LOC120357383 [Solenopsis invicta]|uniref:uncharacterized protein LOC120357370 n=1 Tax=Solenopsis invicta TaxID=13686 RepID=UPI00193EBBE5|nr:uncharacterized protein LOC120357370 [Solenopsis invicta]XP_039303497.1 uncharacterized protein LOC120357383 [Solenopsis invicta]